MAAGTSENSAALARVLGPGHKFRNLNPFWVLGIPHTTPKDELKNVYRRVSLRVHPDKNPEEKERAEEAFEAVKRAYETLTATPGAYNEFQRLVLEAEGLVGKEKRRKEKAAKRERRAPSPFDYDGQLQVEICNRIADAQAEAVVAKQVHEAQVRARDEEAQRKARKRSAQKAFKEEWEKDREARVASWRKFAKKKKRKKNIRGRKETPAMPAHVDG